MRCTMDDVWEDYNEWYKEDEERFIKINEVKE
jgi:hypothetical protein